MKRNVWAPVGAVAATVAVVATVSLLSTDRRPASPPVLRIVGAGSADSAAAAAPGSGSYRLVGALPNGPETATIRDLPATAAPVARVRALATALGVTAPPVRLDNGWTAEDLRVTDEPGNPWTWGEACDPETTVSSGRSVASDCPGIIYAEPVSPGGGAPGVDLPLPLPAPEVVVDETQALAATDAVRKALELDNAEVRTEGPYLMADPLVADLPTSGMTSSFRLSADGALVSATGWLSTGTPGERYPLRSAQQALDDLPVLALGAPCDAAGCPDRPDGPVVTGARLGLSRVALAGPAAALVPSWLFDVEGSPVPLVALAVADRFLGEPDLAVVEPGTEPGGTGSDPGTPSDPDPGPPTIPEDREMFGFDGAYADPDPTVLVVRYGDSGSCPSLSVQHSVMEEPDRIVVILSRTSPPPDLACTSDYQAKLVRVTLKNALSGREVVDGSRKEPVPVSTGSPPFG